MTTFDHALFALLVAVAARRSRGFEKLSQAAEADRSRLRSRAYLWTAVIWSAFGSAVISLWAAQHRPLAELGVDDPAGAAAALTMVALLPLLVRLPRKWSPIGEGEVARAALLVLPHSRAELWRWMVGSAFWAAGEELCFRAFALAYLGTWMPKPAALVISAALFAVAHRYQGRRGVVFSGAVGLILGGVYLLVGFLFLPIVLHALWDIWVAYCTYRRLATASPSRVSAAASR